LPLPAVNDDLLAKLEKYSALPLECDGMTRVVTYLLTEARVKHRVKVGMVYVDGKEIGAPIHWWVTLPDGRIIDYKLRMWAGDGPSIPHGVFKPAGYPRVSYRGVHQRLNVSPFMFAILTGAGPASA
jgi:hypothetical protein